MNKNKINSIIFIGLILCVAAANISGAETINGKIDVEINHSLGIISPYVDIANKTSVTIGYERYKWEKDANETVYMVNDTLKINLNIIDNINRTYYLLPRLVYYTVYITRSFSDVSLQKKHAWEDTFFNRIIPVKSHGAVNVVDSYLGENKTDNIIIPLRYTIENDTTNENLTLHIILIGMLPGDIKGISGPIKIVEYKKVSLNATYVEM